MNKKIYASISIFTSILTCSSLCNEQKPAVGVQLIGIYNMLTKASNAPSAHPARVLLKSDKTPIVGDPWTVKAIRLPTEVEVIFENKNLDDTGKPQPYIIRIEEDTDTYKTCPSDKICIKAEVYLKTPGDLAALQSGTTERTCVSNSKFGLKAGDLISQFQNVMLFITDQDSEDTKALPFKFGIAAWTSTAGIWDSKFVSYSPACSLTQAPQVNFTLKETTYRDKLQNLGLFVLQGQPAWGGGQIPRAYHMHIVHIFNNTQYPLLIRRTVPGTLSKYNFDYTIPARTALPFTYIWLPKISQSVLSSQSSAPIRLYVLKKTKKGSLPAGFNLISSIEGEEIGGSLNDADIDAKIDQIFENMSESADKISGYNDRIAELQRDYTTEIWAKGKYLYKICAVPTNIADKNSEQAIVCIKRNLTESTEQEILRLTSPLYKGLRAGTDLRIIINEKELKDPEKDELIDIKLDNYLDNKVFEGYLES
ncbi:MAG TPA: hypothetical protein PKD74_03035 [Candidatus Dependentiae bacterium]|nr:hypothetical protein [Candidatus Dependentiae bacterium]